MSLLKTANLGHHYGSREVLRDINLEVARGEFFALIGPSRAGRTTLLRLIDLLEEPGAGELYFDGAAYPTAGRERLKLRRRMAFVLQKPAVFNGSVADNIACGLRWRGQERRRADAKTGKWNFMLDPKLKIGYVRVTKFGRNTAHICCSVGNINRNRFWRAGIGKLQLTII